MTETDELKALQEEIAALREEVARLTHRPVLTLEEWERRMISSPYPAKEAQRP